MKKIYLTIIIASLFFAGFTQSFQECGTISTPEDEQLILKFIENFRAGNLNTTRDFGDSLVPLKFHVIAANDSTSGIDSLSLASALDTLNALYKPAGIVFYHCNNIDYIYDDKYFQFEKYIDESLCDSLDLPNLVNIYFASNVFKVNSSGNITNLCGYAYLSGAKNRVIMKNSCAKNGSTLAHELGHYFSLPHTHSVSLGAELVDASNCSIAGDLFCDTPADPKLSLSTVNSACIYTGTMTDVNGDSYIPETKNIMSYSRKSCRNLFSIEQLAQMSAYLGSYRNYLECVSLSAPNSLKELKQTNWFFSISPNPSKGYFTISYNLFSNEQDLSIVITNQLGKRIFSTTITSPSNKGSYPFSDHKLSSGMYFVSLTSSAETKTKRVIIY